MPQRPHKEESAGRKVCVFGFVAPRGDLRPKACAGREVLAFTLGLWGRPAPYSLGLAQSACLCSVPFGAARGGAWGGRKMYAFGFVPFGGPVPWGLRRA